MKQGVQVIRHDPVPIDDHILVEGLGSSDPHDGIEFLKIALPISLPVQIPQAPILAIEKDAGLHRAFTGLFGFLLRLVTLAGGDVEILQAVDLLSEFAPGSIDEEIQISALFKVPALPRAPSKEQALGQAIVIGKDLG